MKPARVNRPAQSGKALRRRRGDHGQILFPDGAAQPLNTYLPRHQNKPRDGHGSHHQGKHKLG